MFDRPLRIPSLAFAALVLVVAPGFAAGDRFADGLRPPLKDVLDSAGSEELIPVSVVFKERVDRQRLRTVRAGLAPVEARRATIDLLKATARGSQVSVLARLRGVQAPGRVARIRPLWIGNVVGMDATPGLIREIAARPEVDWVNHNPKVDVSLGLRDDSRLTSDISEVEQTGASLAAEAFGDVECGVGFVRAPEVWADFGLTGEGAVIAVIDTGVCWSHRDIANQIWVNPGEDLDGDREVMDPVDENGIDDDGNGFVDDLIGWNFDSGDNRPDDHDSHGSHVAGSVAGDGTSGKRSGVAPDAKIMVIRSGNTFSDEVDVWNAMQYAADNGADSISMSLGWPPSASPDRSTWRQNCDNTIEAGTAMVIAAGNEGQGAEPNNLRTPGDVPRIISVGATDCSGNAAWFSSRGPVSWSDVDPFNDWPYPPGLVKPDVAGPGVDTNSHYLCSAYTRKSGTSMATPHVAGVVALLKSASPRLTPDEIKTVLMDTAVDLGDPGDDNTFGAGMVDAYAAVSAVYGLSLDSVTIDDSDPDHGNDDGGIDTGELVTLRVTLENRWDERAAVDIRGRVTTETPGVILVHDEAPWPEIAPLGTAESISPHFSVRIDDDGCNYPIEFELMLWYDGHETRIPFSVRVGTPFPENLMTDDFESDQGWTVETTSATGAFVREDPNGVTDATIGTVQPEDDVTVPPGTHAWVTGNDDIAAGDDAVKEGTTSIVSPGMDASEFDWATAHYWRWFFLYPDTSWKTGYFRVQWTRDGGQTWSDISVLESGAGEWTEVADPLPPSALGPDLQIRFQVDGSGAIFTNSLVEGAVDEFTLTGHRVECDSFQPPVVDPPNGVGDSLRVRRSGSDIRLDWAEPVTDTYHGAATLYRVYRSSSPSGGFAVGGLSTETWSVELDGASNPGPAYYLVVAENGGGTSADEPF